MSWMNPPYYLTAYGIAVKHGFRGSEREWLDSLTAYGVAVSNGYTGTLEEWLVSLTAYGQAVAEGFAGSREQWLEFLKGVTFTPSLTEDGWLQWTNDKGAPNPDPVNLLKMAGLLPGGIRKRIVFSIPADAWVEDEEAADSYRYYYHLEDKEILETLYPEVILARDSLETAKGCGMCPSADSFDGYLELRTASLPDKPINAACNLMNIGSYGASIPVADAHTLGAIKGSDTIIIDPDGTAHAVIKNSNEDLAAEDEAVTNLLDEIFGNEPLI